MMSRSNRLFALMSASTSRIVLAGWTLLSTSPWTSSRWPLRLAANSALVGTWMSNFIAGGAFTSGVPAVPRGGAGVALGSAFFGAPRQLRLQGAQLLLQLLDRLLVIRVEGVEQRLDFCLDLVLRRALFLAAGKPLAAEPLGGVGAGRGDRVLLLVGGNFFQPVVAL